MNRRRVLIALAVVALAVVAIAGAVLLLLPRDRIAALAAERAEAVLGREVRIEAVDVDFFPRPAVALEGVAIAGAEPDAPPFATIRRILLQPRLLPLLRRQVIVDAIVVQHPRVLLEYRGGQPDLEAAVADEEAAGTASVGDVAFLIRRFEIQDGRIGFRDVRDGTVVRLDGVRQRLRLGAKLSGGELASIEAEGELEIDALGAALPSKLAVPINDVRVRVGHDAVLDLAGDSLSIARLALTVQEVALEGEGTVWGLSSEERTLSLRLTAPAFDVGALIRSLPDALIAGLTDGTDELPPVGGWARVRLAINGPIGDGKVPEVQGMLGLEAFDLGYGGQPGLVTGLDGQIDFTLDSLSSAGLEGRLLGEPLHVAFSIRDFADPAARAAVRASVDLERLATLGLVPDSLGAKGRVGVDVSFHGPALRPAEGAVDGGVQLAGLAIQPPKLLVPVQVERGRIALGGSRLRSEELRLRMGDSDLALDLTVDDWLPFAFGDTSAEPTVVATARSRVLDLDEILPPPDSVTYSDLFFARLANRPVGGRPAGQVAEEAGFRIPALPPVRIQGRLLAGTLRNNGLELQDVDLAVAGRGDQLEITDASFNMMGGGIQIAGRVGLGAGGDRAASTTGYPAVLTYRLQDVGAAPFFDRLTPFRDHLSGSFTLAGSASMLLDENLLPVRETVMAEGALAIADGQLVNWPALRALGEQLGLARFDTLTFRDWAGSFQVTGPNITLGETALVSDELDVVAAGSFDFGGRLDLAATVRLSPDLASRVRGEFASRLTAAAGDAEGRVPIGVRITGPAQRPQLQLDLSAAADNIVAEVREEAESRARNLAERALEDAAAKLLQPGDSAATPADSARAKLQEEAKGVLQRLIRRRGSS